MSIITDASERLGIPLVVATMMLNLAWAVGEVVGAPAAANVVAGDERRGAAALRCRRSWC